MCSLSRALILSYFLIVVASDCPDGTYQSLDPNFCYVFSNQTANWYDAERYCSGYGGHLTSILNNFENTYLEGIESPISGLTEFWIGATNNFDYTFSNVGNWQLIDGNYLNFSNWDSGKKQIPKIIDAKMC